MKIAVFLCLGTLTAALAEAPARYHFEYKAHVDLPREGAKVRLWLPRPVEGPIQGVARTSVKASLPHRDTVEKRHGNRLLYLEGTPAGRTVDVTATYEITRTPSDGIGKSAVKKGSPDDPARYLAPDRKILLADKIRRIAAEQTRPEQTDPQKIRALYDHVVKIMTYDKSGSGWGQGDAVWACDNERGNCTDFHSLFIALNRSVGIPARFFIGFPIPDAAQGEIPGYHCWAEAYAHSVGWLPVDASEAKKSGNPDRFYGHLPPDRIELSMGRDLVLEPPQDGEPLNYFVYPYVEVDGRPLTTGVTKEIRFRKLDATT